MFAGVYNEYIIKKVAGSNVDIMLQNSYMYTTSVFCNVIFLSQQQLNYQDESKLTYRYLSMYSIFEGFNSLVMAIIFTNALIGIMTSLFILTFNSVLKTFVSAVELILTAILSLVVFGIPIHWNTIVAIFAVSGAIVIYAMNPMDNLESPFYRKEYSKNIIKNAKKYEHTIMLQDKNVDNHTGSQDHRTNVQ